IGAARADRSATRSGWRSAPVHEHLPRSAALYREAVRGLTARPRRRAGAADRRGPRTLQRTELRSESIHRRGVVGVLRLIANRSAETALQQGTAGNISAGLDVEARHGGDRAPEQRGDV